MREIKNKDTIKLEKEKLYSSLESELFDILDYWEENSPDVEFGGFLGRRNINNKVIEKSPKGAVLNSRILWTFSAAFRYTRADKHFDLAKRAFTYIKDYFIDTLNGGVYWTVDYKGIPLDKKKQTYAQAFAIYGLSEYYGISKNQEALNLAISIFASVERHCFDKEKLGYLEAFDQTWQEISDLRLSEKDANEKKTMNTHLHILEAYASLYKYWPDKELKNQLERLLAVFNDFIINKESNHLNLFMNENWEFTQHLISYGHDIEAAWLLKEASEVLGDDNWINLFKQKAVEIAKMTLEGLDEDGALIYEKDLDKKHVNREKHWWVQAEAMVGFYNVYQITGDEIYLNAVEKLWEFIDEKILDRKNGEWFWGIDGFGNLMDEDKLGLWKCPYHNTRACLEVLNRINESKKLH
ncbi:N-acylglucosamine 2-epimerase [Pseudopedobacter saltans DSM 12145]|uniref:Cellobiose 2-epimerase n=1 Tax=Pseudopedobacter saltans (strain ATCC 51119 / DSM 12145 / JCM 21818 / CCUG 39354 / LMG 10337 / NBRC 100064 / NCIMB 13643) TaxID=762903 RepID=F0S9F8_PSESL|nr:AGE family epimerase/isomerase [Pseudopedobacter saltans]ADY53511.1 N-acylglucosamine 2-epimerase [Pseudopedobacter saltans DSM 12145]